MSSNIIKEFTDMKPGANFLQNIARIAGALDRIAATLEALYTLMAAYENDGDDEDVEEDKDTEDDAHQRPR